MGRILIKLGVIALALLLTANGNAWAWMTGAQASAAASSGGGVSTGSFSAGGGGRSSGGGGSSLGGGGGSSLSSGGGYSGSGVISSVGRTPIALGGSSGIVSNPYSSFSAVSNSATRLSTPSALTATASSTSGWMPTSTSLATFSPTAIRTLSANSVFNAAAQTSVRSTSLQSQNSVIDDHTSVMQVSGANAQNLAQTVFGLKDTGWMNQGSFANSALMQTPTDYFIENGSARESRAYTMGLEATKPTVDAATYHSNTAGQFIASATDARGVIQTNGVGGDILSQGIIRPNTDTTGGVQLAHSSDFTTSMIDNNPFFRQDSDFNTAQESRAAYFAARSAAQTGATNGQTTTQNSQTNSYYGGDIPESIRNDASYTAGGWVPSLPSYNNGRWGNSADSGPTYFPAWDNYLAGESTQPISDPMGATAAQEQD